MNSRAITIAITYLKGGARAQEDQEAAREPLLAANPPTLLDEGRPPRLPETKKAWA